MLNTIYPFISSLIKDIDIAFEVPDHINGFSAIDPLNIPVDAETLTSYGSDDKIYCNVSQPTKIISDNLESPIVNKEALEEEYKAYMLFILEDHLKYKNNQTFNLSLAEQSLKNKEKSKQTLASFLSKQKLIKVDKNIKTYQSDVEELKKIIKIHF